MLSARTTVGLAALMTLFIGNLQAQDFKIDRRMQLRKNSGLTMGQDTDANELTLCYYNSERTKEYWYRFQDRNHNNRAERSELIQAGLYIRKQRDTTGRTPVMTIAMNADTTACAVSGYLNAEHHYIRQSQSLVDIRDARIIIGRPLRSSL